MTVRSMEGISPEETRLLRKRVRTEVCETQFRCLGRCGTNQGDYTELKW